LLKQSIFVERCRCNT
jgi:hypothetical protein